MKYLYIKFELKMNYMMSHFIRIRHKKKTKYNILARVEYLVIGEYIYLSSRQWEPPLYWAKIVTRRNLPFYSGPAFFDAYACGRISMLLQDNGLNRRWVLGT